MTVLSTPAPVTFDCLVTDQFTSIREKFSRVDRSASNALTTRSSKKTAGNKMKRKPKVVIKNWISHFQTTRPHVMMMLIFSSEDFPLRKKYSPQQKKCVLLIFIYFPGCGTLDFDHLLLSYALVNIVIRFFNFSVTEVTGGTGTRGGGLGLLGWGGFTPPPPPTFFQKMVLLEQVFALLLNWSTLSILQRL